MAGDPRPSGPVASWPIDLVDRLLLGRRDPLDPPPDTDLAWWRGRALGSIIQTLVPLSLVAWIPGVVASIYAGVWEVVVLDTLILVGLGALWVLPTGAFTVRVALMLGMLTLLSLGLLSIVGVHGGGFVFGLAVIALAALLLGRRAAACALGLVLALMPPLAFLSWSPEAPIPLMFWILEWSASAGSTILLGAAIAAATTDITEGLDAVVRRERLARAALDEERTRLAQANAELEAEVARREGLERQLRQAGNLDALGRLARGIAHDLNNLLQPIRGHAELLVEAGADHPQVARDAQAVLRAADRAAALVAQVLAFGRPAQPARDRVDLRELLHEAGGLARAGAHRRVHVAIEVPEAPVWIRGDRGQLQQVLLNLFTNAVEASATTGGIITLACGGGDPAQGTGAWLSVRDDGPGMPPEVAARCFEPFTTTRAGSGGTGLGLAIVHGLVTGMDGLIAVDTAPGQGTTFRITLPASDDHGGDDLAPATPQAPPPPAAGPPAAPAAGPPAAPEATGLHALVVDDEDVVRRLISRLIAGMGLQVSEARDGLEALERLRAPGPAIDLLVTDRWMPGLTGEELAERASGERPGLPIILMSGDGPDRSAEQLAAIGVRTVLAKPIGVQALRSAVAAALPARDPIPRG